MNSVLEREPSQPILTSILSILLYFDNSFMIQYQDYEKLSKQGGLDLFY